jgi:hypothetical protein
MRLLINILSLLTLLVLLTAENCGGPSESYKVEMKERQISDMYQSIENDFIKDELSIEDLNAFEKRAIQKLQDITDYINIYADTNISVQFRKQANQMIVENFIESNDVNIFYKNLELLEDTLNTALYYLKYGGLFKTEFSSIEITNHFKKEPDLKYKGEIQLIQRIAYISQSDTFVTSFPRRIGMIAIKTEKYFGNEIEDVWEVYFSEAKLYRQ